MNIPEELRYTKSHEWVSPMEDGEVCIGLTDYAQSKLGDLVFVNLPMQGDELSVGASFADVESVKAVSDVFSPVSGTVAAINEELLDDPAAINRDCYGAWLVQVKDISAQEEYLTAAAYQALLEKEGT